VLEGVVKASLEQGMIAAAAGDDRSLSARVSVNIGFLDETVPKMAKPATQTEPLIDVIEEERGIRVVVLLPGVKREDVSVSRGPGTLRVEVSRGDTVYAKEIPCASEPASISVVSKRENNSVVELVFAKKERKRK
jgi:HSP20 family molecular chaperone IbpA